MSYQKKNDLQGSLADDLKKCSEEIQIKEKFGCIPKSIMNFKKSKHLMEIIKQDDVDFAKISGGATARGGGYAQNLRYSIYNPDMAEFIIKYFTKENDLILDPFMGRITRPAITLLNKRRYIGIDTCQKTIDSNKNILETYENYNDCFLYHGDSTSDMQYHVLDDSVDCVFTCPPYYNIEKYSGEKGDLSHLSEEEFDIRIQMLFNILYKKIKTSVYSERKFYPVIFTVGSIRKGNKGFFDMSTSFQKFAENSGFVLHDKLFTENRTPGAGFTFRRNYLYKFLTKNFETTIIFMKYE